MRALFISLFLIMFATPAFAGAHFCKMTGPNNCFEQSEDLLIAQTKNTITHMALTNPHAFKTQNDWELERYVRAQAYTTSVRTYSSIDNNPLNNRE